MDRPLHASWEDPLPHALTSTRTYLGPPGPECDVAIIAIHGRGDSARDFADTFVPHLRNFFGSHLKEEVDEDEGLSPTKDEEEGRRIRISLRSLEAMDGTWFLNHKSRDESDIAFQGPYVFSSLTKLRQEIEFLNKQGIPNSKIILVGYSQGAILINTYLIKALEQMSRPAKASASGQEDGSNLPLPHRFLAWAGTCLSFEVPFPQKGWPYLFDGDDDDTEESGTEPTSNPPEKSSIESHQQCGLSDRYFDQQEIEKVAAKIAKWSRKSMEAGQKGVKVTVAMEPGGHSILPGMIARLIQMIQDVSTQHQ